MTKFLLKVMGAYRFEITYHNFAINVIRFCLTHFVNGAHRDLFVFKRSIIFLNSLRKALERNPNFLDLYIDPEVSGRFALLFVYLTRWLSRVIARLH